MHDLTIGTLLVPIVPREFEELLIALKNILKLSKDGRDYSLAISIDGEFTASMKARILDSISRSPPLRDCEVIFIDCHLDPNESFYHRTDPKEFDLDRFPYGWKSGPNKQFFTSLKKLIERKVPTRSVLLMETDAFPLADCWIDRINEELLSIGEFLVAGSEYRGLSYLPPDIERHLNGNAVYALAHPHFEEFLRLWEAILLKALKKVPFHAYDVIIEWVRSYEKSLRPIIGEDLTRLLNLAQYKYRTIKAIGNFSGRYETTSPIGTEYAGFHSVRDIELLHVRVTKPVRDHLIAKKNIELSFSNREMGEGGDVTNIPWQFPATTELLAYQKFSELVPDNAKTGYAAFPWATLIDYMLHNPSRATQLLSLHQRITKQNENRTTVVTVCQHVHMLEFQYLFAEAGITDIFWAHKTKGIDVLPSYPNIRIHEFPLFPVQAPGEPGRKGGKRRYLFSFVGARGSYYLTDVRQHICELLSNDKRGLIIERQNWHYDSVVYHKQILGRKNSAGPDATNSRQFRDALHESIFTLCPSGSGPNSIRLWEAIAAGSIPVILSDNYAPPGNQELWKEAAVFWGETAEAVKQLPDHLETLAKNKAGIARKRHALRQLWMLYGHETFIYDIQKHALRALAANNSDAHEPLSLERSQLVSVAKHVCDGKKLGAETRNLFLSAGIARTLTSKNEAEKFLFEPAVQLACQKIIDDEKDDPFVANFVQARSLLKRRANKSVLRSRLKVFLMGRHAKRTPLAYAPYRKLFEKQLEFVDSANEADLLVFGFYVDIEENWATVSEAPSQRQASKIVVLSEEPLWDTVWSGPFREATQTVHVDGTSVRFDFINHANSSVFDFREIPYFITTNDDFFLRYSNMFRRNAKLEPGAFLEIWRQAAFQAAFFAEKRRGALYDVSRPADGIWGLSSYRTEIANAFDRKDVLRVGVGWSGEDKRQMLPDWHLDKLATLDKCSVVVSGMENTHSPNYITEKIFDAFAVAGVPIYYASSSHRIREFVRDDAYLNVFGLKVPEAVEAIAAFAPDYAFAKRYRDAQQELARRFSSFETLLEERESVATKVVAELQRVANGSFGAANVLIDPLPQLSLKSLDA